MPRSRFAAVAGWLFLIVFVVLVGSPSLGQAPKYGGGLTLRLREDLPQGFAIHETATISTMWPAMPCFSNLVLFDSLKTTHRMDAVIGELAERWSWQDNGRSLVFFLRTGVRWHDGKPLSSKDVKFTFDLLREAPDAPAKLRINPRRDWYANLEAVEAVDPQTVAFRLKRPQPSLLLMLASGYTPIYAAHVPPASYRTGCVGTGPFKLKEWRKGEFVEYVKNPDYFVKGRPYLGGLRYLIIGERGTATAALQAGRVDTAFPGQTPKPIAERLKKAVPQLVMTPVNTSVVDHLVNDGHMVRGLENLQVVVVPPGQQWRPGAEHQAALGERSIFRTVGRMLPSRFGSGLHALGNHSRGGSRNPRRPDCWPRKRHASPGRWQGVAPRRSRARPQRNPRARRRWENCSCSLAKHPEPRTHLPGVAAASRHIDFIRAELAV